MQFQAAEFHRAVAIQNTQAEFAAVKLGQADDLFVADGQTLMH